MLHIASVPHNYTNSYGKSLHSATLQNFEWIRAAYKRTKTVHKYVVEIEFSNRWYQFVHSRKGTQFLFIWRFAISSVRFGRINMNPLIIDQQVLSWFCVCLTSDTKSVGSRIASITFSFSCLIANACAVAASATFFAKFVSIDLEESLYALFQITAYSQVVYIYIMAFILRHKVTAIFGNLLKIYNTSKSWLPIFSRYLFIIFWHFGLNSEAKQDSFHFLVEADRKNDKIWKILLKLIIFGYPASTVLFCVVSALVCYWFNGNFVAKYLYHPHKLRWVEVKAMECETLSIENSSTLTEDSIGSGFPMFRANFDSDTIPDYRFLRPLVLT